MLERAYSQSVQRTSSILPSCILPRCTSSASGAPPVSVSCFVPCLLVTAGTYSTHVWRFRQDNVKTGLVLLEHVGPDATVELTEGSPPRVVPGIRHDIVPRDERPVPPEWGSYRQRGEAQGVPIMVRRAVARVQVWVPSRALSSLSTAPVAFRAEQAACQLAERVCGAAWLQQGFSHACLG